MADGYVSIQATNGDALVVPVKAAAVYAAEERSLFLGGALIPVVSAPNGIIRVGELAKVTATQLSNESAPEDITPTNPGMTKNDISADLFASRAVVRDLGGIDVNEIGTSLGKSIATAFDKHVYAQLDAGATQYDYNTSATGTTLSIDDIFEAVEVIRSNGEMGPLYGIMHPSQVTDLLKDIGAQAYAGGEFQTEGLRNGFFGRVAGVTMFMSSNIASLTNSSTGFIFGEDAARIAMQKNVDIEVGRRPEAVGFDVVANLHAGCGFLDAERAVRLRSVA